MTNTVNGHGFFRKSKAYGLVCGIALGLAFFGSTASAEEVASTQTPTTTTEQVAIQTVISQPNTALQDATNAAQNAGVTVTQTPTQDVVDDAAGQKNYDEQAVSMVQVAKNQEAINAQNQQIEQTNQANAQAANQAQKTVDATNQFVDDAAANHSDSTVTTQTVDYGSGSAADIKKGEETVKAIDDANQVAVKNHEAEEAKRAEAISNQAKIDQENHDKLVKFINDNYVRNVTSVTDLVVKPDAIKSLTSNNPNSIVKVDGNITTIETELGAGESVTHTFLFNQPVVVFDALGIAKIEETIKMISTQSTTGKTGVVQRNAIGSGVFYTTNIPDSTVNPDGLTNYIRTYKYFTAAGELVTPELLVKTINAKADGVYGLTKAVSTLTNDEVNYDTIKNNDTTNSRVALRYFTSEGVRSSQAGETVWFDTTTEALAYLKANPASGAYVGTSILQEGSTWDETANEYKAIRNSQISYGFLLHKSDKVGTAEDVRSGQSFSFGGGFSVSNTDFVPAENIVIPTVSALKLVKVDGKITPAVTPKKQNLKATWHFNQYKHNLVTVKDVIAIIPQNDGGSSNQGPVSIDGRTLQIGDKAAYTLLGAKILANGKDKLVKYDFEDILDTKHDKYVGYNVYAFVPITLTDGTVLKSMADFSDFVTQTYDAATGRFYVSLNSDFLARVSKNSDFQVQVEVIFERIAAGEVTNVFTNNLSFEDETTGEVTEVPVPSNPVKTVTPEPDPEPTPPAPTPEAPKPTLPAKEAPVAKAAVLPETGEASSILSLVGSMSLLGLGFFSRKRKK